jgi:hypothetical protein|eukprot:COSAG06_NODE_1045_length_10977_cov_29.037323_6_plen_94_part_00
MLKQLQTLGCDTKDVRASIEITDASPWSPKLGTFARRLAAGVLPMGKATGCKLAPDYTTTTHGCLLRRPLRYCPRSRIYGAGCAHVGGHSVQR